MTTSTFDALNLSEPTLQAVEQAGYIQPTPVQVEAVPAFLSGGDVIIQSQTGTGKTAAFVLPIVDRLSHKPGLVQVLVLVPTRELSQQVSNEFNRLGAGRRILSTAIYGGTSFQAQYDALETAQIVVATPGRLLDLLRRKRINLDDVIVFGLDEADEMLSMGFERDVLDVIGQLPGKVQSFLCSATVNDPILRIASGFISDPTTINCSSDHVGAQNIEHHTYRVPEGTKVDALRRIIRGTGVAGGIVFCNMRSTTFRVTEALRAEGYRTDVLNGELSQSEREAALGRMRDDAIDFLVATDVAARGIDISGLPSVINYDMPESPEIYIHRTGRTGRAGQAGIAYSIVVPSDISVFHALQKFFKLTFTPRSLPTVDEVRQLAADRLLVETLATLDADAKLPYAEYIPIARRLAEHGDGDRTIAKLIAHFKHAGAQTASATEVGEHVATVQAAAPEAAAALAATAPTGISHDEPVAHDERKAHRTDTAREQTNDIPSVGAPATKPDEPASTRPKGPAPTPTTGHENPVFAWFVDNVDPKHRGRFRGPDRIAKALDMEVDDVERLADAHPGLERARGKRTMWRLRSDVATSPQDAPARERAPGASETHKAEAHKAETRKAETRKAETRDSAPREAQPRDAAPREPRQDEARTKPAPRSDTSHRRQQQPARPATPAPARPAHAHVLLRLNIGANKANDPEEIAEHLYMLAGLDREDLGRVAIQKSFTTVEVRSDYWRDLIQAVNGTRLMNVSLHLQPVD